MRNRTLVALAAALVGLSAHAADYYVVMPVKGKTLNVSAIDVALAQSSVPGAVVGSAYNYDFKQNLQVTGDPAYSGFGVKWAVSSGALPAGLTLNTDTGVVSGTPTSNGVASFVLSATYKTKAGTQTYQIPVSLAVSLSLAAGSPPQGVVGVAYSFNLTPLLTVSGDPSYAGSGATWTVVSSSLPAGLYLTSDGYIGGTPTAAGTGTAQVRATYKGANGDQTYQVVTVDIVVGLGSATLPSAVTGVSYAGYDFKSLLSVSGDPAYTSSAASWSLTAGALPAGLTLSSTGVVSGSPTTAGSAGFTLRASYRGRSASQNYLIAVDQASVTGSLTANTDADYGSVAVGASASRSFTFTNNGNAPATGLYASVSGTYLSLSANTCGTVGSPISLAKGASCSVTAQYAPTAASTLTGSVSATWSGPNASSNTLNLSGSASADYSAQMSGFTRDPVAINRNTAWASGQQWYWVSSGAESSAPIATYEFRRVINVPGTSNITAYLYGAVDNTVTYAGVNGTQVLTNPLTAYNVLTSSPTFTLVPGLNVVSIKVANVGASANPAGFTVQVRQQGGTVLAAESGWKY